MLKILLILLFVCLGTGVYFIVYDKNNLGKTALALDYPQQKGNLSHLDNGIDKQRTISDVNKNHAKQSSQQTTPVLMAADTKLSLIQEELTKISEPDKKISKTEQEQPSPLWEQDIPEEFVQDNTIEHEERIKTNPESLANLQVGQVLEFFVPQLGESFQSEIESTSNQLGEVKVWKGNILGEDQENSNFIMTQGAVMTNVVLATNEGVYTVHIDNETGEGTVIDDREYSSRISDTDDSVPYHHEPRSE